MFLAVCATPLRTRFVSAVFCFFFFPLTRPALPRRRRHRNNTITAAGVLDNLLESIAEQEQDPELGGSQAAAKCRCVPLSWGAVGEQKALHSNQSGGKQQSMPEKGGGAGLLRIQDRALLASTHLFVAWYTSTTPHPTCPVLLWLSCLTRLGTWQ